MKKYLLYNNIVHGAGIAHTLMCYNQAVHMAMDGNMQLIVPKCIMGHGLGSNFEFEDFFGLDKYDTQYINNLFKEKSEEVQVVEFSSDPVGGNGGPQNGNFVASKYFFMDRFLKTVDDKNKRYASHLALNKNTISIHIRRGDLVYPKSNFEHYKNDLRMLPDMWFKNSLLKILDLKQYTPENTIINIYSELQKDGLYYNENGEAFDLKTIFDMSNCRFYFNGNMWECLYNMFTSDIFIGGTWGIAMIASFFRENLNKETYFEKRNRNYMEQNKFKNAVLIG